jgi:hypothetical protein
MTIDSRESSALDAELQQAFASLRAAPSADHPSEDDWARFAGNEMSAAERIQVADHVVSCTDCATIFRVVSHVVADAKVIRIAADHRPALGDWRVLAAAAAVVLTIGLGTWWALRAGADRSQARADSAPPIAAPAVGVAVAPSASWASLPSAPDVRLPPNLILAMRGTEGDREAFLRAFGEAIAPYRAGRFGEAAAALAPVAERYSDVVETWFYLGTARLYNAAPAEAIEPLRRALTSEVVGADARWLQAVALQRAGQEVEARAALQAICDEAGDYRDRACAVVKP